MGLVQHRRDGGHLVRKQRQVEFGIALLHHAAQQASRVDAPGRPVDGTAVASDLLLVAGDAPVGGDQFPPEWQVGTLKNLGTLGP